MYTLYTIRHLIIKTNVGEKSYKSNNTQYQQKI
jgi:hypothetical protein